MHKMMCIKFETQVFIKSVDQLTRRKNVKKWLQRVKANVHIEAPMPYQ